MFEITAMKDRLQAARLGWRGCDWPTSFGPRKLDLYRIRSRQATLASKATRGDESASWREAAAWLDKLERDAETAADWGTRALSAAEKQDFTTADQCLAEAERLEEAYGQLTIYRDVRNICREWFPPQAMLS